jgi:hypothetical protein
MTSLAVHKWIGPYFVKQTSDFASLSLIKSIEEKSAAPNRKSSIKPEARLYHGPRLALNPFSFLLLRLQYSAHEFSVVENG